LPYEAEKDATNKGAKCLEIRGIINQVLCEYTTQQQYLPYNMVGKYVQYIKKIHPETQ
jgi:hypothetical protein